MADDSIPRPGLRPDAVALVTGASAGIGEAVTEALAEKGCRVIAAARSMDRLRAIAGRIGPACHAFELDVTDPQSTAGLCERLPAELREIDILINNAGHDIGGRRRFDLGDAEQWAHIIETNITGMIRVTRAVVPQMIERGRGHIVNLGSIAGLRAYPGGSIYAATKFAVRGFTSGLRADYAGSNIRVSEILPGTARTEFARARLHDDEAAAEAFYDSFETLLTAADIARCVVFALEQPAHVVVAQLVVVPTSQW